MSTNSLIHQAKLAEWAPHIADQKASGLTVTAWCEQNNISRDKFFYWKRLLKDEAVSQMLPDIVPVSLPSTLPESQPLDTSGTSCTTCTTVPTARIIINGVTIELNSNASESLISHLIKVVRYV